MSFTIIIVLLVLSLMTLFLFLFLKREINDINNKSRVYFNRKIQEYTENVVKEEHKVSSEEKEEENGIEEKDSDLIKETIVYVEKKANYEINDLLKMMKTIDENFNLNNEKIIKTFIKSYVSSDEDDLIYRYKSLNKMKKCIDKIGVYNIITTYDEDLISDLLDKLRLINEDVFMEYYYSKEKFDVEEFCNFINYEIGKCDPTIYVFVGDDHINYNNIDKRIKTIYSKDIYKGIKIVYLNKLYDYSLS